jgi:microsomal epoxide hydrolase
MESRRGADGGLIRPFRINVSEEVLADLRRRIDETRWIDELQGAEWSYGTNQAYLKGLVEYWRGRYDWRAEERRLNAFEQFTTEIDGVDVHFIHRRAKGGGFPLLITHGWPGSVMEFVKVIGPLTDPASDGREAGDGFDVVIPSIPGFGFSGKPRQPGYGPERMASILATLMARLGYSRYGIQGGDWGAIIGTPLAIMDAQHVAGLHLNMCQAPQPASDPMDGLGADDARRMKQRLAWVPQETAYGQIQGTKPQSIGQALNDSPVGLAAWIVEKFRTWCDCEGNPENRFTKDELLTNVMIYWVTQSATSAARMYYESRHVNARLNTTRVPVPTACLVSPKEIGWSPRPWVERKFNLVRWTEPATGGHFAALEQPKIFVDDVRAFFASVRVQ